MAGCESSVQWLRSPLTGGFSPLEIRDRDTQFLVLVAAFQATNLREFLQLRLGFLRLAGLQVEFWVDILFQTQLITS